MNQLLGKGCINSNYDTVKGSLLHSNPRGYHTLLETNVYVKLSSDTIAITSWPELAILVTCKWEIIIKNYEILLKADEA